jgi:hypothetical protein
VQLTNKQSYELLANHGVFVREICDRCGQILGPGRYTRKDQRSRWCSRQCRDGVDTREPGTCRNCRAKLLPGKRRGAIFCDDACRKAPSRFRTAELSRTKASIYAAFSQGKSAAQSDVYSGRSCLARAANYLSAQLSRHFSPTWMG